MPVKYSDIIRIRAGKPAYNIVEEKGDEWTSFIPNKQFNEVLNTVLSAVRGTNIDQHKSIWLNGTYGTGKSHAASVIAHLLGDEVDDIRRWVDYEYKDDRYRILHQSIFALRAKKRLLPVRIKGRENLTHVSELAPLVQTRVVEALNAHDIELEVDTDYDTLIAHVQEHEVIWDDLIARNPGLMSIVADRKMLVAKLRAKDAATLRRAKEALRGAGIMIMLQQQLLGDWLVEVQNKLRADSPFCGLLILWDEFTEVMDDALGLPVLKDLQAISEKFMNIENDSFIFLISHPSAFNRLDKDANRQTDGRYHRLRYNMEAISAFRIMSRKFEIRDQAEHNVCRKLFYNNHHDLVQLYTARSNDKAESEQDLYNLFPIHPGTANLATHYATTVGSSSRSVFEFIGDNESLRSFLDSEEAFANGDLITADMLWDFVLREFQDDVANYGAVTERYNTFRRRVEHEGPAVEAVFKAILLLNAFNNVAAQDTVVPNTDNVRHLFAGTRFEPEVDDALEWINDNGVIQRTPDGTFSVLFSALPSHEIEEIKQKLKAVDYRFTSSILKLGDTARTEVEKKFLPKVIRPYTLEFYSEDTNDSILRNRIKNAKRDARPSNLFLALLMARNNTELAHLKDFAEQASQASAQDKDLRDIVFIVADRVFGDKDYERFIEYMASYTAAGNHGFMDQVDVHRKHAEEMIRDWMGATKRGNASIYVNGQSVQINLGHLSSTLNGVVSPIIFPKGPEAVETLRTRAATTFWKPQVSKEIIRTFISGRSRSELTDVSGVMKPIQYLLQDAIDENLEWKKDIPAEHPLKAVYDLVNSTINNFISHGNTSVPFDLAERLDTLTRPPYGLAGNYASAACIAFAMRPWINRIYDPLGKARTAENLADDVTNLVAFWEKGKKSNKLSFRFQTPQEGKLCRELIGLFSLKKQPGYTDISSMGDARFAITGQYLVQKQYPLWSLKHMTDEFVNSMPPLTLNEKMRQLIDQLCQVLEEGAQKNVQLTTTTLQLIGELRTDFRDILNKPGSFRNGFENFLRQVPIVDLKEEEMAEAVDFIRKHLESTIGYWTEREVTDQLKNYRMSKQQAEEAKRRREEEEKRLKENGGVPPVPPAELPRKKVTARERIDAISDPAELRALLDKLIDLGYGPVLETIING